MQYKKKFVNDKILQAGMNEYLDKGFRQGNITTIAENAGVPVGNLYRYFNGKGGLLDALVKKTYQEFPKLINQLASIDVVETDISIEDLMQRLTQMLLNIFEQHGKEIILMVDKCENTRYDDFAEKTIEQIAHLVFTKFYGKDATELDQMMSHICTKAFVNSMFDLLRMDLETEKLEQIISRVMNFYF